MKKWLLLIGYGVPYAFLAMYADAAQGTMLGYAGMIAGFSLLAWAAVRVRSAAVCAAGNAVSFLASLWLSNQTRLEQWQWYFKPFAANGLLCALSAAAFAVQIFWVCRGLRRRKAQ